MGDCFESGSIPMKTPLGDISQSGVAEGAVAFSIFGGQFIVRVFQTENHEHHLKRERDVISTITHLVEDALESRLVDRDRLLFDLFVGKKGEHQEEDGLVGSGAEMVQEDLDLFETFIFKFIVLVLEERACFPRESRDEEVIDGLALTKIVWPSLVNTVWKSS